MGSGTAVLDQLRPRVRAALDTAYAEAVAASPPGLLDLCAARVVMLVGGTPAASDDPKIAGVAGYATSPLYSDLERRALEFTEQYVMDVASMPDDLVAQLEQVLGPEGLYGFVMGLYVVDQRARLDLSAAVHPGGDS